MHERTASLFVVLVGLLAALTTATPAQAYEADTHYAWTYYLCLQCGYMPRQAYQIASATYAIDEDPDTGPLFATAGDALFGANHPGLFDLTLPNVGLLFGLGGDWLSQSHVRISLIWRRFHAFLSEDLPLAEALKLREADKEYLKQLALEQRNPGPLLHFIQDSFAHGTYTNKRGHAFAGHAPDFLSYDGSKARAMTDATVEALLWFRTELKLPGFPHPVPAISTALELMCGANRPSDADNFSLPPSTAGRPSLSVGLGVVCNLIQRDQALRDLPPFELPAAVRAADSSSYMPAFSNPYLPPPEYHQYDFDGDARVTSSDYAVEQLAVVLGKAELVMNLPPNPTFPARRIEVRQHYAVTGVARLSTWEREGFVPGHLPLWAWQHDTLPPGCRSEPVIDAVADIDDPASPGLDGRRDLHVDTGQLDLADGAAKQALPWHGEIRIAGLEPVTFDIDLSKLLVPPKADDHTYVLRGNGQPQLLYADGRPVTDLGPEWAVAGNTVTARATRMEPQPDGVPKPVTYRNTLTFGGPPNVIAVGQSVKLFLDVTNNNTPGLAPIHARWEIPVADAKEVVPGGVYEVATSGGLPLVGSLTFTMPPKQGENPWSRHLGTAAVSLKLNGLTLVWVYD